MLTKRLFRRLLQAGLQDLIEAEATVKIGANRYERSPVRTTRRHGTRAKRLPAPVGGLDQPYGSCCELRRGAGSAGGDAWTRPRLSHRFDA